MGQAACFDSRSAVRFAARSLTYFTVSRTFEYGLHFLSDERDPWPLLRVRVGRYWYVSAMRWSDDLFQLTSGRLKKSKVTVVIMVITIEICISLWKWCIWARMQRRTFGSSCTDLRWRRMMPMLFLVCSQRRKGNWFIWFRRFVFWLFLFLWGFGWLGRSTRRRVVIKWWGQLKQYRIFECVLLCAFDTLPYCNLVRFIVWWDGVEVVIKKVAASDINNW